MSQGCVAILFFFAFTTHEHICSSKRIAIRDALTIVAESNETDDDAESDGVKKAVYGGCFCPPHKGHFAQLMALSKEYEEVYIFMYGKSEERHGYRPEINKQIWNIYKTLLPDEIRERVKLLDNSIVQTEPYIAGTQLLAKEGKISKGDSLTIAVGSNYTQDRRDGIERTLNTITAQLEVGASVAMTERSNVSASAFCRALDAAAYTYKVGTPVMYTSSRGWGKYPAVVESVGLTSKSPPYRVKLDINHTFRDAPPERLSPRSPGLEEGDCVIYTSQTGQGKFFGSILKKDAKQEQYTVRLDISGAEKETTQNSIEPCGVIDPRELSMSDFQRKFLPEGLNGDQLKRMRQLLLTKSKLG